MQKYQNNVQDQFGNAITGVIVTIRTNPGGVLATIFSDNGVTPKANPFSNDADGEFFFYAPNGRYDIELTGTVSEIKSDFLFLDLSTSGGNVGITADINTATPPTTEAVTAQLEYFDLAGDDLLAQVGFNGSNTCRIANRMHGGNVQLNGEDAAGGARVGVDVDPDAGVIIRHPSANVNRFGTGNNGHVYVDSDTNTDAEGRAIVGRHQNAANRWTIGQFAASTDFRVINNIHSGHVTLEAEDAGGQTRVMVRGDPDGSVSLYTSPTATLTFVAQGAGVCNVHGNDNLDASNRIIDFRYANGTVRGEVGHGLGGTSIHLGNAIHGGNVVLTAETVGGVIRTMFQGDPDGAASMYHAGASNVQSLRTQEYNIADNVSGAEVLDGNNVWQDVGFNVLGQQNQDAAYTIHRSEAGYDVYKDGGAAVTYTIPAAAAAGQTDIPVGAVYEITNEDTENLTIDGTQAGITLRWLPAGTTGNRTIAQWGKARLQKRSDSLWFITGVGIT